MGKYEKIDALNQVEDFHQSFHHPVLQTPVIPSESRCKLRISLIAEELGELEMAVNNKDITGVADALCDIQYVLAGAILEFGLGNKFVRLFDEVQRSNMSKACLTEDEAINTVKYYRTKDNTDCYYKQVNDKYLVYRKQDNKTLKSINYSPADLQSILNE